MQELRRIVNFYDYLEIQPTGQQCVYAAGMTRVRYNSEEDLENINRKIVASGEAV